MSVSSVHLSIFPINCKMSNHLVFRHFIFILRLEKVRSIHQSVTNLFARNYHASKQSQTRKNNTRTHQGRMHRFTMQSHLLTQRTISPQPTCDSSGFNRQASSQTGRQQRSRHVSSNSTLPARTKSNERWTAGTGTFTALTNSDPILCTAHRSYQVASSSR